MQNRKLITRPYLIVTICYMLAVIGIGMLYSKPGHSTVFLSTAVSVGLLLFAWMLFNHFYIKKRRRF